MENKVTINDFVWAKITGFPPWPAVILEPNPDAPLKTSVEMQWVYFFGSNNYAWVEIHHLKPYRRYKDKFIALYKTTAFKEAVKEIDDIMDKLEKDPDYHLSIKPFEPKEKASSKRTKESKDGAASKRYKQDENNELSASQFNLSYDIIESQAIKTSKLTFGVIGMGIIGSRITLNLVKTGHKVNIWNRTAQKCVDIQQQVRSISNHSRKLKVYLNPRALMQNSDIVYNCVSDSEVSLKIIQNFFGINSSNDTTLEGKGFVEVTTTDPETSKDMRDMIEMKGGRYLEAQIQGSKMEASEGKLVILAAGSRSLFFDCQSCFDAFGKTAYYLGDVGYASKINLILQLIRGICLAGLAEGFALAQRSGIDLHRFLSAFKFTKLNCSYLTGKAEIIAEQNFHNVEQSLQNLQKDMFLGLEMSNKVVQPMNLASIANEILKHCRRYDLSDQDASCIFLRNRF